MIRLAHLSAVQRRALVIADNRIAENAGWDEEPLGSEPDSAAGAGFRPRSGRTLDDELIDLLGDAEASGFGRCSGRRRGRHPDLPEDPSLAPAISGFWRSPVVCAATARMRRRSRG